MRVTLTDDARHDLELIYDYIAGDDLAAAVRVGQRIRGQVMALTDHPKIGRVGRVEGTRELVINRTPYVVVYRLTAERVEILRVLHGAQQWPPRSPRRRRTTNLIR